MRLTLLIILYTLIHTICSKNSREEEFSRIQHYELIDINTNLFESAKIIDFTVFNQYYKIQLLPNEDLIPSKVRHTSMDIHTTPKQHEYFKSLHETCHYFGNVLNTNTYSAVALSLCPKGGIRGRITAFNQTIIIKPSAHYFDFKNAIIKGHDISDQVLIYKASDFDTTNIGKAHRITFPNDKTGKQSILETNDNVIIQEQRRRLYSSSNPACIELLIINGPERTKRFQNNYGEGWYSKLYNDIADIINQVSVAYAGTNWGSYIGGLNAVKVKWVELEVVFSFSGQHYNLAPTWLRADCTYSYSECPVSGFSWLRTISNWIYQYKNIATFDNVQLISDMEFSPTVGGWGNSARVCKGSTSVSDISEQWGHDFVIKSVAHELGHNLGMQHDKDVGCDPSGFIMGGGNGRFSSCSISAFQQYMSSYGGLTCLGRHQTTEFKTNYGDNVETPPTTTTTPAPQPTLRPTTRPTTPDNSGDWGCFGIRNVNGVTGLNGNWAQSGTYAGKIAYYLNGYYLFYHTGYGWWLIAPQKGSTSVKGYCKNANLQACNGLFRSLATTGNWVDEISCQIYNCQDTPDTPTPRPTARPTTTANQPTAPVNNLPCSSYDCLRISSMALDAESRSYNGDWRPIGCHNGQSYYGLNGQTDRKLCYSSYNMWVISEGLCPTGRTIGYSPQKGATQIASTQNNWNMLGSGGWILDTSVTLTPCGGNAPFIDNDDSLECIENNIYSNNVCIYSNNTLWNGNRNFELHPSLCSRNKPVYRYTIYNETTNDNDDEAIATDKTYNNINIINIYYLHYYQELKYSDGDEMIGKWIITQREISLEAIAICEKENLIECNANSWIVDKLHEGEDNIMDINGTEVVINDGWFEKVIDQYMMIENNACEVNEEDTSSNKYNLFIVIGIIVILIVILIVCVIGCCIWHKREKRKLKTAIQKVSMGGTMQLGDNSDDENDGELQLNTNETQMIEVDVEIEDDEAGTPLNRNTKYN
eukprot:843995_1